MRFLMILVALAGLFFDGQSVSGHEANDAYLEAQVEGSSVDIRWDVTVADLDFLIGLDSDLDGNISRNDLNANLNKIEALMFSNLELWSGEQACILGNSDMELRTKGDIPFLSLLFTAQCSRSVDQLRLNYSLLFDVDYSHRGVVRVLRADQEYTLAATQSNRSLEFTLADTGFPVATFRSFFFSGADHIVEGYDHIAFLLVLVFSVLRTERYADRKIKSSIWGIALLLTAFTVSHAVSITLMQLGLITVPSRLVESVIALSIVLAALDAVKPVLGRLKWMAIFVFGLIHGLGFAGSLGELGLQGVDFFVALLGFNVGIELGQIFLAILIVGTFAAVRRFPRVQHAYSAVSIMLAGLVGLYWFFERAFGLGLVV